MLTFHIQGLFRTEPGWNLWIGGSPNFLKDGIQPLTGVVETDWSPFTFTMNWRFTRPGAWVHFDAGDPICFFFPVQRGVLNEIRPRFAPMQDNPETMAQFTDWSRARTEFHRKAVHQGPAAASEKWQKHYYRGVDVRDNAAITDHQTKLRLAPFAEPEIEPSTT